VRILFYFILFLWQVNLEIDVKGSLHPKLTVVDEAKAIGAYHVVLDSLVSLSHLNDSFKNCKNDAHFSYCFSCANYHFCCC
jgi:hypothetical protein